MDATIHLDSKKDSNIIAHIAETRETENSSSTNNFYKIFTKGNLNNRDKRLPITDDVPAGRDFPKGGSSYIDNNNSQ